MTVTVKHVTVDCIDPYAVCSFWAELTGYHEDPDDPNAPADEQCWLEDPHSSFAFIFQRVPEAKTVKNRVHLDVAPTDRSRDAEVERILGFGGVVVDDRRVSDGTGWVVMADPEGNEFCVERSDAERDAAARAAETAAVPA